MNKRILFVHQSSAIGGGSYCLLNVIKSIDRNLLTPIVALNSDGPLVEELIKIGVEVLIFPHLSSIPYNKSLFSLKNILTYIKVDKSLSYFKILLNQYHIDIVYLNNMMVYRYLRPAKECGCRTVLHCREHWPLNEHTQQLSWIRKYVDKYCDQLIAINKFSASIFSPQKTSIIYDWIDMQSRYEKRPLCEIFGEDMQDKKVFLYTGGMQPIKGAVQVLDTFVNDIQDANARLLCVGLTPIIESDSLRGKIKKILSIIGYKTYNWKVFQLMNSDKRIVNIPATYMLTDIMQQCYCNLSFFTIPHANLAMVETSLLGIPSVAAENEEALEYTFNGFTASLFEANNKKAFADAIFNLIDNYEVYKERLMLKNTDIQLMFNRDRNVAIINKDLKQLL